jgi:rhodanese-related sulfurtransferase
MAIQMISPQALQALVAAGKAVTLIDVRTPVEFNEVHAVGARLLPLDELNPAAIQAIRQNGGPVYFICKGGTRGGKACQKLVEAGIADVVNIEGGTAAWIEAGLPVVRDASGKKVISLERQVRIAAGILILIGASLGWLVHPGFFGLCAFIGAGLVFAGITDFCGMGLLLARMPWNRCGRMPCTTR